MRLFTLVGDGTHRTIKISYNDGTVANDRIMYLIISRYSALFIHAETDASGHLIRVKSHVIASFGNPTVITSAPNITIMEDYTWNNYTILAFCNNNFWNNITFSNV